MSDDDTGDDNRADTSDDAVDPQARIAALERQNALERTSFETGVPVELLAGAETPDDMLRIATDALLWQADSAPPRPQTGAVSVDFANGIGAVGPVDRLDARYQQVQTRDAVSRMTPAEILAAWRTGYLSQIGVGAPIGNGSTPLTRRG